MNPNDTETGVMRPDKALSLRSVGARHCLSAIDQNLRGAEGNARYDDDETLSGLFSSTVGEWAETLVRLPELDDAGVGRRRGAGAAATLAGGQARCGPQRRASPR